MLPGYQVFMNAPWLLIIYKCSLVTKYLWMLPGYQSRDLYLYMLPGYQVFMNAP